MRGVVWRRAKRAFDNSGNLVVFTPPNGGQPGDTWSVVSSSTYANTGNLVLTGSFNIASGNLAFNANETNKTITVVILNDAVTESSESFTVTLSAPSGENVIGSTDTLTVTIADDDFGGAEDPTGLKSTHIGSAAWEANGTVHLTLTGPSGTVTIQRSSDLQKWETLTDVEMLNRTGSYTDSDTAKAGTRFYRVIRPIVP